MEKKKALILSGSFGFVVLVTIFIVILVVNNNQKKTEKNTVNSANTTNSNVIFTPTTTTTTTTTQTNTSLKYKNGEYATEASYQSPAGLEKIKVKITLASDTVTAVEVTPEATDRESKEYQNRFKSGISQIVVGKKIDQLSVSRVNGSSLTPNGFNKAVESIKKEAIA